MPKKPLLLVAVTLATLLLAACGGNETAAEPTPETAAPPATQPATTEAVTIETPTTAMPTTEAATHEEMGDEGGSGETEAETPAGDPAVAIDVAGGEPVGGVAEISVHQGDLVDFSVASDTAAIVHVHGYEIERNVEPGTPVRLTFEATLEGIFEIELHGAGGGQIAKLVVEP